MAGRPSPTSVFRVGVVRPLADLLNLDERFGVVSAPVQNEIELSFGSDIAYLDFIQEVSDSVARMLGFDTDALYWIGLSVREAVTNAIQHGNRRDPSKKVRIFFRIAEDCLRITVRDQGDGIQETQIPDPLDPENLLKPGGRGIFFVRSFMDNVRFNVRPEGGSEIIMEKVRDSKNQGENNDN
jgi:serine/threonine-protein kinase RsbW